MFYTFNFFFVTQLTYALVKVCIGACVVYCCFGYGTGERELLRATFQGGSLRCVFTCPSFNMCFTLPYFNL